MDCVKDRRTIVAINGVIFFSKNKMAMDYQFTGDGGGGPFFHSPNGM